MALERSMFTETAIRTFLPDRHRLHVESAERLPLGTANCYRIVADGRNYFLKEFQSGFSRVAVEREAMPTEYLLKSGIPAARIYQCCLTTPQSASQTAPLTQGSPKR